MNKRELADGYEWCVMGPPRTEGGNPCLWAAEDAPDECFAAAGEAEPDPECDDVQPARPEPKFQVGQVGETDVEGVVQVLFREWRDAGDGWREGWWYTIRPCAGGAVHEDLLHPHTMTLNDVPDKVLVAAWRGKPLRVVECPVSGDGTPTGMGRPTEAFTPSEVDWRGGAVRGAATGWWSLWNLELAEAKA